MLTIIDRYVLRQVAKPLATAMAIGLLMLLAERLVRLLDTTLGKKNSFGVVFELLAYLVPHYLGTAIPAALFLGLLFGFNKLSKDSEIDAIMATGTGLHRLTRPVILLSLALGALSLFIVGWLQPQTRYAYRSVLFDVKNVEVFYLAEEGVFMQAGTRTFILDKLNRSSNTFDHVFLFDYRGPSGLDTLTASSGMLIPLDGDRRPVLRLDNGHRLKLDRWPSLDGKAEIPQATVVEFATTDTPLGRVSDSIFRPRGEDERELTLPELYTQLDTPPKGSSQFHAGRTAQENCQCRHFFHAAPARRALCDRSPAQSARLSFRLGHGHRCGFPRNHRAGGPDHQDERDHPL
ncbi:MAG TPA: LptF/LptG family permease, partial [Aestuariivirga sp.]|nr:LptF/LptG family permease [Aestuariivirga sp.]